MTRQFFSLRQVIHLCITLHFPVKSSEILWKNFVNSIKKSPYNEVDQLYFPPFILFRISNNMHTRSEVAILSVDGTLTGEQLRNTLGKLYFCHHEGKPGKCTILFGRILYGVGWNSGHVYGRMHAWNN